MNSKDLPVSFFLVLECKIVCATDKIVFVLLNVFWELTWVLVLWDKCFPAWPNLKDITINDLAIFVGW